MVDPYDVPDTPDCAAPSTGTERFYASDRQDEHAPEIAAAGIVLDELEADVPQVFFDAGYEVSTGARDATGLDEPREDIEYDRESLVTAYAVKGLLGDVDIAPRNLQTRQDGTVYPIDIELAGYTHLEDMAEQVCDGESMFETSIQEVAADVGLETEGLAEAYRERVQELAEGIDLDELDRRMDADPRVDRYGPTPEYVAMRRDRQIYQNVIDARSDENLV
jgi:hypothetical protein